MEQREHERLRDNVAAWVIGTLEPPEAAELEEHLRTCESCARDARWLQPAGGALLESVEPMEPPADLRERVMSEVRSDAERRQPATDRGWNLRGLLMRPATALALVAVVVVGVGVSIVASGDDGSESTPPPSSHNPVCCVSATLNREGDTGTLELTGLRQLEGDHVYQAWVQHGDTIEDSSLFVARADGTATAAIPSDDLRGGDAVLVTIEPRGGSQQPTTQPLVNVDVN
jgi:anti-sigma-K factor RskA